MLVSQAVRIIRRRITLALETKTILLACRDLDGFFNDLRSSTDFDRFWIKFDDYHYYDFCITSQQGCSAYGWYRGYPMPTDFTVLTQRTTCQRCFRASVSCERRSKMPQPQPKPPCTTVAPATCGPLLDPSFHGRFVRAGSARDQSAREKDHGREAQAAQPLFPHVLLFMIPSVGEFGR